VELCPKLLLNLSHGFVTKYEKARLIKQNWFSVLTRSSEIPLFMKEISPNFLNIIFKNISRGIGEKKKKPTKTRVQELLSIIAN